jgi:hypothetical protein
MQESRGRGKRAHPLLAMSARKTNVVGCRADALLHAPQKPNRVRPTKQMAEMSDHSGSAIADVYGRPTTVPDGDRSRRRTQQTPPTKAAPSVARCIGENDRPLKAFISSTKPATNLAQRRRRDGLGKMHAQPAMPKDAMSVALELRTDRRLRTDGGRQTSRLALYLERSALPSSGRFRRFAIRQSGAQLETDPSGK